MKDPAEACKGVPKPVYQWLMQNAPDALIEMSGWATDLSGPWPAEDAPGDADVFVNFADDHSSAVRFRATFDGVVPEFEEEDEAEAI